jgi:SAM-dependent methyltransferase
MITRKGLPAPVLTLMVLLSCFTMAVNAQEYTPSVGQDGKDVIWVPTPEELITAMLDMAKVNPSDYVIDLGSGDGRIVIAAAKRGARALGVEYNPDMVELSKRNAQKEGVSDKATFLRGDIFETDFSKATVITMYLLPDLNLRLRPKILDMKPGTRVVSHAFSMGDWEADQTANVEERTAYLWIVPAKVAGTWTWHAGSGDAELTLNQSYQRLEGSLKSDGRELPIRNAKLEGEHVSFEVGEGNPTLREYSGRVVGNSIEGTAKIPGAPEAKWAATRRAAR